MKENVRANMGMMMRNILPRHGHPPNKQERSAQTVLEQAELMAEGLVA